MNQNFNIVITATDRATQAVKKVNDSVSRFIRPVTEVKRAVMSFGSEMGFGKISKSLGNVASEATKVGEKMGRIIAPMSAIVGVGSLTAIAELAKRWGDLGLKITNASLAMGVSADTLQGLRAAAQVSGVSADALTSGMKTLGDTLEDALYGRNQDALLMMNRLGIGIKRTADGAVDSTAAFDDLATAISRIKNPQVQGLVARTFGLEEALPLLRKGKEGIAELQEEMRRSGAVMSGPALQAALGYQQAMARLDIATGGLKNTIGSALIPAMQPVIEKMTEWIMVNRKLIATKIADIAGRIANALESINWTDVIDGVEGFVDGVMKAVQWIGGWKHALIALAVIMNGSLIASVINLGMSLGVLGWHIAKTAVLMTGSLVPATSGLMLRLAMLTETALPSLSGAFLAVGAAIEATPIGWIITGIALVSVAGYELVKHWDDIKHWWHRLWGDMSDDTHQAAKDIGAFVPGLKKSGDSWGDDQSAPGPANNSSAKPSNLLGLVRQLENSGDNAVSPAGAIGRYQIMPGTARQYGFDASKLADPEYNKTVASTILDDLQHRYNGDTDAVLAAYNGGPGRANQFLAAGRNPAVLPLETQKYLAHSHQLLAQSSPAVPTPYAPAGSSQLRDAAAKMGIQDSSAGSTMGGQAQQVSSGAVKVEVVFSNTPPGTKTRVNSDGAVRTATKIGYSMPNFAV